MPQSFANAASERIRSGLSPNTMRISAAESAPMPYASRSVGDAWAVQVVEDGVVGTHLGVEVTPAAC